MNCRNFSARRRLAPEKTVSNVYYESTRPSGAGNSTPVWKQLTFVPKITALIHAYADAERLGRTLDSLRPCDQVLVVTHDDEATQEVARAHGATLKAGVEGVANGVYLVDAANDWIFCIRPDEALSEALEAALFEWKEKDPGETIGYSVALREETASGWKPCAPQMRLVNRGLLNWTTELPPNNPAAPLLAGDLLRFSKP